MIALARAERMRTPSAPVSQFRLLLLLLLLAAAP
jgi:hypothetical protein